MEILRKVAASVGILKLPKRGAGAAKMLIPPSRALGSAKKGYLPDLSGILVATVEQLAPRTSSGRGRSGRMIIPRKLSLPASLTLRLFFFGESEPDVTSDELSCTLRARRYLPNQLGRKRVGEAKKGFPLPKGSEARKMRFPLPKGLLRRAHERILFSPISGTSPRPYGFCSFLEALPPCSLLYSFCSPSTF